MNFNKKEVKILKSGKNTLESVFSMKTQDVKKTLTNELMRIEEEMKRHFAHQKAEISRLHNKQQLQKVKKLHYNNNCLDYREEQQNLNYKLVKNKHDNYHINKQKSIVNICNLHIFNLFLT